MSMRLHFVLWLALFTTTTSISIGQTARADSLRLALIETEDEVDKIKTMHLLFGSLVNNHPDSALLYANQAFLLSSAMGNDTLHGQSIMNLTHAYFVNNQLDSVKNLLKGSISFYQQTAQFFFLSAVYRNLAVVGEVEEQPDTSLFYLQKCLDVLSDHPDSIVLGDVFLSQGFAYRTKGYYELSVGSILNALRIFELIGNSNRMGYAAQNMGITLVQVGRLDEALIRNEESVKYFLKSDNHRAAAQSLNNVGRLAAQLGDKGKAVQAHQRSLTLAKSTEQEGVITDNYYNLVRLYFDENMLDSANYWLALTQEMAGRREDNFLLGGVARYRGRISLLQGNESQARRYLNEAKSFLRAYIDPQHREEALLEMSLLAEGLGESAQALIYWKQAKTIQDSLFTLHQDRQVEELQLIYETEKKDAQIALLHKSAQLDRTRKTALAVGLVLITMIGIGVIYTLLLRRKSERALLEKQKEIEVQKRMQTEQELRFKQRELVAKALQLAKKNEFLASLEKEVGDLKSTVDERIQKSSKRISRLIAHDVTDEAEWNQFSKEFASVHREFLEELSERHGSFSSGDLRLIALLKMNLSSKDIAHTLRISYEGVKKARYRLRKKLNLDKEIDLQTYLLSF